jgi:hypothetical protein
MGVTISRAKEMPPHMSVVRILLAQKVIGAVAAGDAEAALALRMRGIEVRLSRNERKMDMTFLRAT